VPISKERYEGLLEKMLRTPRVELDIFYPRALIKTMVAKAIKKPLRILPAVLEDSIWRLRYCGNNKDREEKSS
jgi:hypothetical protein